MKYGVKKSRNDILVVPSILKIFSLPPRKFRPIFGR